MEINMQSLDSIIHLTSCNSNAYHIFRIFLRDMSFDFVVFRWISFGLESWRMDVVAWCFINVIDCILIAFCWRHGFFTLNFDAPFGRLWLGKLTPLANARLALLLKAPPKADSEALEGLGSESLSFWKWLIHQIPVVDRSNSKTLRLAFSEHESST